MQKLPMLEDRRGTLEKCVFCPKLCRTACPVSNAIPRETLTPWGKMSMSYFVAQGDVRPMRGRPRARAELERLLASRAPLYAQADVAVDTSGRGLAEVVDAVEKDLA